MNGNFENELKRSFDSIKLGESARARIISVCRAETVRPRRRVGVRRAVAIIVAALLAGGTICAAVGGVIRHTFRRRIPDSLPGGMVERPKIELSASDSDTAADDYVITCDAVAGGGGTFCFELTLRRSDGGNVIDTSAKIERVYSNDASATLPDGTKKNITLWGLDVSTPAEIRLGGTLIGTDSLIGENVTLNTGHIGYDAVSVSDPELTAPLCELLAPVGSSGVVHTGDDLVYADGSVAYGFTLEKGDGRIGFSEAFPDAVIDSFAIAPHGEIRGDRQYDALYIGYSGAPVLELDGYRTDIVEYGERSVIAISAPGRDVTLEELDSLSARAVTYISETLTEPREAVVRLAGSDKLIEKTFEPVEVTVGGGTILFDRISLSASALTLSGSTDADELPGLEEMMKDALIVGSDGKKRVCGDKFTAGTTADGRFEVSWILREITAPDEVSALEFGGAVFRLG